MSGRKSAEVKKAVDLVLSGHCKTVYAAAKRVGVSQSSIHRDPRICTWKAEQKAKEGK